MIDPAERKQLKTSCRFMEHRIQLHHSAQRRPVEL